MRRGAPVPETVTLHVPFRLVKRGGRKAMQLPDGAAQPHRTDSALVKALARAFRWKRMLEGGGVCNHCRACDSRGDSRVLHDAGDAIDVAGTRDRRSDPGREAGASGDAGRADGVRSACKRRCESLPRERRDEPAAGGVKVGHFGPFWRRGGRGYFHRGFVSEGSSGLC